MARGEGADRCAAVVRRCRVVAVAGAMMVGAATQARAQAASPDSSSLDSVLKMLNLKTDVGQAPDFVQASRPKTKPDFMPIGTGHATRPIKVKSAAELQAAEAELDAARVTQDKLSGRKPPDPTPAKVKLKAPKPAPTQN